MTCARLLYKRQVFAANRNDKFSLMDQKVIVLDTGANPTSCSQGYLDKHGILYQVKEEHRPPRKIRTAKGIVKADLTVTIPFCFEHQIYSIDVLVLSTPALVPILFGSNSFRKAKATINYKGIMEMTAFKSSIVWDFSNNSGLYYIRLHQKHITERGGHEI